MFTCSSCHMHLYVLCTRFTSRIHLSHSSLCSLYTSRVLYHIHLYVPCTRFTSRIHLSHSSLCSLYTSRVLCHIHLHVLRKRFTSRDFTCHMQIYVPLHETLHVFFICHMHLYVLCTRYTSLVHLSHASLCSLYTIHFTCSSSVTCIFMFFVHDTLHLFICHMHLYVLCTRFTSRVLCHIHLHGLHKWFISYDFTCHMHVYVICTLYVSPKYPRFLMDMWICKCMSSAFIGNKFSSEFGRYVARTSTCSYSECFRDFPQPQINALNRTCSIPYVSFLPQNLLAHLFYFTRKST
jgi:hypothetical protein